MSVCVIGAGILGLPTAVYLQEKEPRAKITIVAENFSGDTTSDVAAGNWKPYLLQDPRDDVIKRWAWMTYDLIGELFREDALKYGAGRHSGYELNTTREETPFWADCVPDFRRVSANELERLGWSQYRDGFFFTNYYLESKRYLPVLLEKFRSNGGVVEKRKLRSLNELAGKADVIVNCSGLGSQHLVGDESCYPVRGQVFKVRAPFVRHFVFAGDYYILPNHDVITLGGTHQENDWRTTVDKKDSVEIWESTTAIMPCLKNATVLGEFAGLRPARPTVRLEVQDAMIDGKLVPIVHNYGHGGSGVTLHHGCALDAADLAKNALHKKTTRARL